jgi:hypothetical protein
MGHLGQGEPITELHGVVPVGFTRPTFSGKLYRIPGLRASNKENRDAGGTA